MSENFDKLNTAYQMLQYDLYVEKMLTNVRCLLKQNPTKNFMGNDFKAGELVYLLAATYENFYDRFTAQEHQRIEEIVMKVLDFYYKDRLLGRTENMFFDEHIWQFEIRRFLQASLVMYDKYPAAKEYLEYYYELWNTRGPGTGFNRDGAWHNGANYFSANAVSLCYLPTLFSYLTGFDFLQHPWYKNAGIGTAYTWLPGSLSAGFGDGHEKGTASLYVSEVPLPIFWPAPPMTRMPPGIQPLTTDTIPNLKPAFTVLLPASNVLPIANCRQMHQKLSGSEIAVKW